MTRTQPRSWNDRLLFLQAMNSLLPFSHEGEGVSLPLARILGAMISIFMLGAVLALLPIRGFAASMADLIACAGILLANGMMLAASQFLKGRYYKIVASLSLFSTLCFALLAGVSHTVIACLALLVLADGLLHRRDVNALEIGLYGGASTGVFLFALSQAWPLSSAVMMIICLYLPILAELYSKSVRLYDQVRKNGENRALDAAFLSAALESETQILLMVDRSGMIEASTLRLNEDAHSVKAASAQPYTCLLAPGLYLGDAILLSDRVSLFQALSDAIHQGKTRDDLLIRVREAMPEGGYSHPPCFIAHTVSVTAAKEISARAIVALKPIEEVPVQRAASESPLQFSARAAHDFVGPFNAGLGFIELLMDDKLTPKGGEFHRECAHKAHQAVMSAFRNATLLAKAITVSHMSQNKRNSSKQILSALMNDAVGEIGVRNQTAGECVHIECGAVGNRCVVEPDKLRFALQVMLTIGLNAKRESEKLACTISDDEADCHIMLHMLDSAHWTLPPADGFEQVLEKMITELTGGQFSRHKTHGYILTIPGAFSHISGTQHQSVNPRYRPRLDDAA